MPGSTCRSVARSCPSLAKLMSSLKRGPRPCMLTLMDRLAEAAWVPCAHAHSMHFERKILIHSDICGESTVTVLR